MIGQLLSMTQVGRHPLIMAALNGGKPLSLRNVYNAVGPVGWQGARLRS
jgi:hypothetical protein